MADVILLAIIGILAALTVILAIVYFCIKPVAATSALDKKVLALKSQTSSWLVPMSEMKLGRLLGKGSQGEVFLADWRGTTIAVKKIDIRNVGPEIVDEFCSEADIMRRLRHPALCMFMGVCLEHPHLCILTELVTRGSLFDILHDECIPISWNLILRMATDIAEGMNYLHCASPAIIHRDLKSLNLLVDEHWRVKVVDFGMTRLHDSNATMTQCGSPLWMAPEMIKNVPYDEKVDIYSFAICLWELYTRRIPYRTLDLSPHVLVSKVVKENLRPPIPKHCPPPFAKLMRDCWHPDPVQRPTFGQVLTALADIKAQGVVPIVANAKSPNPAAAQQAAAAAQTAAAAQPAQAAVAAASSAASSSTEDEKALPSDSWKLDAKEVVLSAGTGRGMSGEFFNGRWRGKEVCVRRWSTSAGASISAAAAMSQQRATVPGSTVTAAPAVRLFERMAHMRHPNIVLFMGAYFQDDEVGVVTESLTRGTLSHVLADQSIPLEWDTKVQMMLDIALGLSFLHGSDPSVLHKYLSSKTLLVDANLHVKVFDYCFDDFKAVLGGNNVQVPSPVLVAPEVLQAAAAGQASPSDCSVDVFNFGTVVWEILTRQDVSMGAGQRPAIPKSVSKDFRELIESCWNVDPEKRPRLSQILSLLETIKKEGPPRMNLTLYNAKRYHKKKLVMAFQSKDPVTIMKGWGKSHGKPNAWVIVGDNDDVYCCDQDVFESTYEAVDGNPNFFRKVGTIMARKMTEAFAVKTSSGTIEHGNEGDFLVQNEANEQWPIESSVFTELYEEAPNSEVPAAFPVPAAAVSSSSSSSSSSSTAVKK